MGFSKKPRHGVFSMDVSGFICLGSDGGQTALFLCASLMEARRSWVEYERCTAVLVSKTLVMTVHAQTSECDVVYGRN